jgi:hypothetical protein
MSAQQREARCAPALSKIIFHQLGEALSYFAA